MKSSVCSCWCCAVVQPIVCTPMKARTREDQGLFIHLLSKAAYMDGPSRHLLCGIPFYAEIDRLDGTVPFIQMFNDHSTHHKFPFCEDCIKGIPGAGESFDMNRLKQNAS